MWKSKKQEKGAESLPRKSRVAKLGGARIAKKGTSTRVGAGSKTQEALARGL